MRSLKILVDVLVVAGVAAFLVGGVSYGLGASSGRFLELVGSAVFVAGTVLAMIYVKRHGRADT